MVRTVKPSGVGTIKKISNVIFGSIAHLLYSIPHKAMLNFSLTSCNVNVFAWIICVIGIP